MATHAAWTICGRTGEKERVAAILFRQLAHLLEIEHLAEGHAPQRENILMQIVALGGGPALEGRGVAAHGAEVAVVQPVLDGLFLLNARPLCLLGVRVAVAAERELRALLWRACVEVLGPARADQEDVSDLDVAALRGGPDVDPLVFAHGDEVVVADGVGCRRVVFDPLRVRPRAVVEEHRAAGEPVGRPVWLTSIFMLVLGFELVLPSVQRYSNPCIRGLGYTYDGCCIYDLPSHQSHRQRVCCCRTSSSACGRSVETRPTGYRTGYSCGRHHQRHIPREDR